MLTASAAEPIVYWLTLALTVSIFINLSFFNKKLQKKMGDSLFKKNKAGFIRDFLLDQAHKTHNASRHIQRKHLSKKVIRLRNAYLSIEGKAIDKTIDSVAYWSTINTNLEKLLSILTDSTSKNSMQEIEDKIAAITLKLSESKPNEKIQAVLKSLDKFHNACLEHEKNPLKIAHYSKKLDELFTKLSNASFRKLTEKTAIIDHFTDNNNSAIENLESHTQISQSAIEKLRAINPDDYDFSFDSLQKNQIEISNSVNNYSSNVNKFSKQNKQASVAIISSSNHEIHKANADLDELSEQIQEENEQEIQRLRDIIKNQKNLIIELEKEHDARSDSEESDLPTLRSLEIERLKGSLKNSEMCINTLEAELANLQKNYNHYKNNPSTGPVTTPLSENSIKALEATVSHLKNEVDEAKETQNLHANILEFIGECLDANSIEDISLFLYQTLEDLGWNSGLIISVNARNMEIDPQKIINSTEKISIKNMHSGEIESKNNNRTILFHHQYLAGKITLKDSNSGAEKQQKSVLDILEISNKVIKRMESVNAYKNQKKSILESSNNIKKLAQDVDNTINQINKRTLDSVSNSFGQMQDIARSKGLNTTQLSSFKHLEEQTLNEISADNALRLKVKKQFLLILKLLESCE